MTDKSKLKIILRNIDDNYILYMFICKAIWALPNCVSVPYCCKKILESEKFTEDVHSAYNLEEVKTTNSFKFLC